MEQVERYKAIGNWTYGSIFLNNNNMGPVRDIVGGVKFTN
jgi:hypothetical protein